MGNVLRGKQTLTREQREQMQRDVWTRRQRGDTQEAIAEELEIDQSTVSRMLKSVSAKLAKQFEDSVASLRAEQTAQLDYIQQRAMTAFNKSEQDAILSRTVSGGADGTKITDEEKGQSGNAKFLQVAIAAIALKSDLHGTKAAKKQEISGPGGAPIKIEAADMAQAEKDLTEWRKKMQADLSNLPSVPPT